MALAGAAVSAIAAATAGAVSAAGAAVAAASVAAATVASGAVAASAAAVASAVAVAVSPVAAAMPPPACTATEPYISRDSLYAQFTPAELTEMRGVFNGSLTGPSINNHTNMDYLPHGMRLGDNFTFEEFVRVISESRADIYWFKPQIEVPLILAYVLIMILGVLFNGLICFVIMRKKKLRTVRNMFIMNLAISDIIMCVFCMPFTLLKLLVKQWWLGDGLCRLVPWLQAANVFASTLTITAIALDRYHVILYPTCSFGERTKRWVAGGMIVAIWVMSAIIGLPLLFYSQVTEHEYMRFVSYSMCVEIWPSSTGKFAYAAVILVLQFVAPIITLITIHWRICTFLKCRINQNPTTPVEMNRAIKDARRHRKNSTLLMAIAVMFALCWFPLTLLNFLADFNFHLFMFHNFLLAYGIAHIIAMTSACLNPVMYGWFNSNFRREFARIACFWRYREDAYAAEKRRLMELEQEAVANQKIVFTRRMSYKAIQTEVQPVYSTSTKSIGFGSSRSK